MIFAFTVQETLRRKKLLARADTVEYSRLVQLHELKQKERMKHIKEVRFNSIIYISLTLLCLLILIVKDMSFSLE